MFGKFSRRHFAKLAGFSALGMAAARRKGGGRGQTAAGRARSRQLPGRFCLGHGDIVLSDRGAVNETAGRSIWGTRSAIPPGKIEDGTNADSANDHYHRYKEDVA
jgi:beta-glucosidase